MAVVTFWGCPATPPPRRPLPVDRRGTPGVRKPNPLVAGRPRIVRVIFLIDRLLNPAANSKAKGLGDIVDRWLKQRFNPKDPKKYGVKNARFLARLARGCACNTRTEVLNRTYPFHR